MKIKLPPELLWACPVAVPDLIRLGGKMDGGYLVPKSVVEKSQGLLSFGLGDDFTFDQGWQALKPNDPIHMYDASVSRDNIRVNVNSSARGHLDLKSMYDRFFQGNVKHISQFIDPNNFAQALDHIGVEQVFVKMDIEGAEYNLIDLFLAHKDRITGIAMEWHQCENRSAKWREAVEKWKEHYTIVHLHGNNHVSPDSDNMFGCTELTHVRNDLVVGKELRKQVHIPELDYSNVSGQEDYEYYFE